MIYLKTFDLDKSEVNICNQLLQRQKDIILKEDPGVTGFNIGINDGGTAGQTVMHSHIHLIPRRDGDIRNPRGGVRGVIPGKMDY